MKYFHYLIIIILGFFYSLANANLFDATVDNLQAKNLISINEGKVLVVLLTMPNCPNCEYMEKKVFSNKEFEKRFNQKFYSVRLDITENSILVDSYGKETTPNELAKRLRVYGSPSFVFYDDKGGVIYRYTGKLDLDGFKKLISYVSSGQYESKPFQVSSIKSSSVEDMIAGDRCSTRIPKSVH